MADTISVEVACATPDKQMLKKIAVKKGATAGHAIDASGIAEQFPELSIDRLQVGVWSRPVARTAQLREGDRVEIYRPLGMDPREARRRIADSGGVMGSSRPAVKDPD